MATFKASHGAVVLDTYTYSQEPARPWSRGSQTARRVCVAKCNDLSAFHSVENYYSTNRY